MPATADTPIAGPLVIASAAFSAASVSASWTAGAFRRLELHLRVTASGAGNAVVTLTGLGGTYSSWAVGNLSATAGDSPWPSVANAATWTVQNGAYLGQTDASFQVAAGGLRTFTSTMLDASNGYVFLTQGSNTDTTSAVSGLTLTFPGTTAGWFELIGYA